MDCRSSPRILEQADNFGQICRKTASGTAVSWLFAVGPAMAGLLNTEFLQLVAQRPEADAQKLGRRGFILVGLGQGLLNRRALHPFQAIVKRSAAELAVAVFVLG